MDARFLCEGFLAQASLQPVGTQVPAHRLLEIANSRSLAPALKVYRLMSSIKVTMPTEQREVRAMSSGD